MLPIERSCYRDRVQRGSSWVKVDSPKAHERCTKLDGLKRLNVDRPLSRNSPLWLIGSEHFGVQSGPKFGPYLSICAGGVSVRFRENETLIS